ncbi:MAG: hypothetical protein KKA44_04035, partial [Alphaproteobacteria bacterium]|nr:hypothetical protein [Alphaproteobacteria bacterium]
TLNTSGAAPSFSLENWVFFTVQSLATGGLDYPSPCFDDTQPTRKHPDSVRNDPSRVTSKGNLRANPPFHKAL